MATVTVFSGTSDGGVVCFHGAYVTARSGAGTLASDATSTHNATGQDFNGSLYLVRESFFNFDLFAAGVTAGASVSSPVLSFSIRDYFVDTAFTVQARTRDWGASLTTADFVAGDSLSGLTLLATIATGSITPAGGYFAMAESGTNLTDAITAALAGDGVVRMLLCSSRTVSNTTPTDNEFISVSNAEESGTSADPKLVFDWVAPASGGMGGVGRMARRYRFHGRRTV